MGYQRDRQFERRERTRRRSCDGCREIADSGLSTGTHTCDQAMLGARAAGLWGGDFDRLPR